MIKTISQFKYHPDPLKTGNVIKQHFKCPSCEKNCSYGCVAHINDTENLICLNCIADGSAAQKFQVEFAYVEDESGVAQEALEELGCRTPGYSSWQGPVWLTHCGEICEFHGDFKKDELVRHFDNIKEYAQKSLRCSEEDLKKVIHHYDHQTNVAVGFYKFMCSKCKKLLLHADFS